MSGKPKYQPEPVVLQVVDGVLQDLPPPRDPRGIVRLQWIATVVDKPSPDGRWPDTKQFWRTNNRDRSPVAPELPTPLNIGAVVVFNGTEELPESDTEEGNWGLYAATRWRWIGVVLEAPSPPGYTGTLRLRPCSTTKAAFKAARGIIAGLPGGPGLAAFVAAVRDGDLPAACMLVDWLEERGDPRGAQLRDEFLKLLGAFFPEVPEPPSEPDEDGP